MFGFRVLKRKREVSKETIARFQRLPAANIGDCMSRMAAGGARLRPLHAAGGQAMAGAALTVKTRPGDNLLIHKALDMAVAGDVVVIDGGGDLTNALVGELMVAYARRKQLAGIVVFGAVRDCDWIRAQDFPVFAAGVTHRGPYKDGPGEVNIPIAIDGMVIEPGDLVVGDGDGVLCVPFDCTDAVQAMAAAKHQAEEEQMAAILSGTNDRAWVDAALSRLGCTIEA